MPKSMIAVIASLLAGFAVAAWFTAAPGTQSESSMPMEGGFDESAAVEDRLRALEAAVDAERQARQLLEDELFVLYETLESLQRSDEEAPAMSTAPSRQPLPDATRGRILRASNDNGEQRLQALTEAGFSPGRAEWILQRESELQMQAMQNRYEAMRSGTPVGDLRQLVGSEQLLRGEIGDTEYEQYLQANGRPTTVGIGRVMQASPALSAGLQSGDQITHYDGTRVFNTRELIQQTMQGQPGESVFVNIVRDGAPMQIVMPRGPLGINTRGNR